MARYRVASSPRRLLLHLLLPLLRYTSLAALVLFVVYVAVARHLHHLPLESDPFHNQYHLYHLPRRATTGASRTYFVPPEHEEVLPVSVWIWEPWKRLRDRKHYRDARDRGVLEVLSIVSPSRREEDSGALDVFDLREREESLVAGDVYEVFPELRVPSRE